MPSPKTLPNGRQIKERIGVFGPPDAGKTHLFFTLAKWHQDLGSDAQFYGINTDTSWDVLYSNPEFQDLTNIHWTEVNYFQEYMDAARKYRKMLQPIDWLCMDLADGAWEAVQSEYARVLTKKQSGKTLETIGDLWEQSGNLDDYPIKGWDWGMPNARYKSLVNDNFVAGPGHRFLIYGEKKMLKESGSGLTKESDEMQSVFGPVGYKPLGQKGDPWRYHTFLRVEGVYGKDGESSSRSHKVTTAKERYGYRRRMGRPIMKKDEIVGMRGESMEDFFMDYLIKVAGWQM